MEIGINHHYIYWILTLIYLPPLVPTITCCPTTTGDASILTPRLILLIIFPLPLIKYRFPTESP